MVQYLERFRRSKQGHCYTIFFNKLRQHKKHLFVFLSLSPLGGSWKGASLIVLNVNQIILDVSIQRHCFLHTIVLTRSMEAGSICFFVRQAM